ncbi:hypothetical protein AWB64_04536 [Caballeronia sordidicola]|uniref:Uncharacterized protein n=1 Tax=Caballeronia sordidicola TaxID=196367 RepID=A0A158HE94_CABSO|nr:hypothetical protein AWB64_04536 [Caballeronia sordidicola]
MFETAGSLTDPARSMSTGTALGHVLMRERAAGYPGQSYWFTKSLNALPAVNLTVLAAAIWMVSPVFGLRPVRAAR